MRHAASVETGPSFAYWVVGGLAFTFSGVKDDHDGRVLNEAGNSNPGLFACGEMPGGLFSGNYLGRSVWLQA